MTSSAQAPGPAPRADAASRKISIRVRSSDAPLHVKLQVEDARGREPTRLECRTPCVAHIEPGREIRLWAHDEKRIWYHVVRTNRSSEVTFSRPSAGAARTVGVALAAGGVVAFIAGYVLMSPGGCDGGCEPRDPILTTTGASLFLGGLAMVPVGGIVLLMSYSPDVVVRRLPTSAVVRESGPSPGAGLKLAFRF